MKTLDRNRPFDTSYGETAHRYLQDGVWFDAQGNEAGSSEGVTSVTRGTPKAEVIEPLKTVIGKQDPPAPPPAPADYRSRLMAMPTAQVKKIFVELGGPEELSKGKGAVAKMADWLVAKDSAAAA